MTPRDLLPTFFLLVLLLLYGCSPAMINMQ